MHLRQFPNRREPRRWQDSRAEGFFQRTRGPKFPGIALDPFSGGKISNQGSSLAGAVNTQSLSLAAPWQPKHS
jgi:hypothetical protein